MEEKEYGVKKVGIVLALDGEKEFKARLTAINQ
jgi:hypothetical protein